MEYNEYNYGDEYYAFNNHDNYTDTWEEEMEEPDYSPHSLASVLLSLLVTAIPLLANVFLVVVLCCAPSRLGTTSNVIFLQRAIADLLSSIGLVLFTAGSAAPAIMVRGSCITFSVLIHVGTVASKVFLIAFAVDSYLLSHPKHNSHPALRRKIWIASALAWILATAAGIAAIFFTEILGRDCCFLRPFLSFSNFLIKLIELLITFLVPLIVTWVFVGVALRRCPHSFPSEAAKVGENGPNRSLMLGLASAFTVTYIIYWIFDMTFFFTYIGDLKMVITLYYVKVALPTICETLSPILVIYLTEDLRQKVAGWVSSRGHSTSLPLAEL